MDTPTPTAKKIDELYELVAEIETALFTTHRPDGSLVTRPMATQKRDAIADLWFVTDIGSHKIDDLRSDAHVGLGYFNPSNYEWVSVSGTVTVSQDRAEIRRLYQPDWRAWFGDEGGDRDGGPDDPRLALLLVDAQSVHYAKAKHSKPVALFEVARGFVTGNPADLARDETLSGADLP